jgi:hypothetical protein
MFDLLGDFSFTSIAILIVVVVVLIFVTPKQKKNTNKEYKYKKQKALFSPAEINFKKSLNKIVVNRNFIVYGKVRIADIITPAINKKSNYKKWLGAFAQIQSKHVDYVICDERDYSVLCVIELDDSSHNTAKAKKRDALVNQAYQSAGIEIVRVKATKSYLLKELLDLFSDDMQRQLSQEK